MKTLVVTNDYPPREGGIQTFVRALLDQFDPDEVAVFASTSPGAADYDRTTPFEVIRHPSTMLLPTPQLSADVVAALQRVGADRVWFGAAAPLGLLAPALRRAGARRLVGTTHGHESAWATSPGSRQVLHRIPAGLDVTTYITEYTHDKLRRAIAETKLHQLAPGVDIARFTPQISGAAVRAELGLTDRPVVACISRLVPRKGQDMLIRAWPAVVRRHPEARLLLVGGGRDSERIRRLIERTPHQESIIRVGSVPHDQLPHYYAACDVFAMPCRTRKAGLDVEGLGMVYLEAAATGKPVVAGTSGGAPEAVRHGETGFVVRDARRPDAVAAPINRLLDDPGLRGTMGEAGRAWVSSQWTWAHQGGRLRRYLDLPPQVG